MTSQLQLHVSTFGILGWALLTHQPRSHRNVELLMVTVAVNQAVVAISSVYLSEQHGLFNWQRVGYVFNITLWPLHGCFCEQQDRWVCCSTTASQCYGNQNCAISYSVAILHYSLSSFIHTCFLHSSSSLLIARKLAAAQIQQNSLWANNRTDKILPERTHSIHLGQAKGIVSLCLNGATYSGTLPMQMIFSISWEVCAKLTRNVYRMEALERDCW